jgi:hypothetical protein
MQGLAPNRNPDRSAVTMGMRRRVRHDEIGIQWDLAPERSGSGRFVSEGPGPR